MWQMTTRASKIKRIGVLTGGGDCPGLNAVIRAIAKTAIYDHNIRVFGIEDGFQGLIENRVGELTSLHVSGILTQGGTILGSNNRCNPAHLYAGIDKHGQPIYENQIPRCLDTIQRNHLDALIVIGGDGTMTCAAPFVEKGVPVIGVPKTIDNDLVGTDITFGFTTAYTTATLALDRLHTTAASHHRAMVCEVMGRNAGWLALHAGVASGSDVILIPEIPFDLESVARSVQSRQHRQRGFSIIVCSEGCRPVDGDLIVDRTDPTSPDPIRLGGVGRFVADRIAELTGIETRTTVLGHVQRGGTPVAADRILASRFGHRAIEVLMHGKGSDGGRLIVMRDGQLGEADLLLAANKQRLVPLDDPIIKVARSVRTTFGEPLEKGGVEPTGTPEDQASCPEPSSVI